MILDTTTMRWVSLCSGYGGLEGGVMAVTGGELVAVAEHEPASPKNPRPSQAPAKVLAHRYPNVPNLGDVSKIDWAAPRGSRQVRDSPELLAGVWEHQADGDEGHAPLAGTSASGGFVRGVRDDGTPPRSSSGPESRERRPGEPADAVRESSPETPLARGPREAPRGGTPPVNWGKYEAAVRRAERALGRPAPDPTLPDGKGGKRRLSAIFVEFMMLLRAGHVTDVPGITRRDMLKILGNGVVPAQASAATLILLDRVQTRLNERIPE